MPQIATPIPVYTTPVPAFDLVNELNNVINQINAGFAALSSAAVLTTLAFVPSRFYGLPEGGTPGTLLLTASTIYAYPLYLPGNIGIKTMNVDVTTGQTGGSIRAGIYADLYGAPGTLVTGSDAGALSGASTAVVTNTYSSPIVLTPGWYWMALAATASSTMPTVAAVTAAYASALTAEMGAASTATFFASSGDSQMGVTATFTFAALPASFPTASYALNTNAAVPLLGLGT